MFLECSVLIASHSFFHESSYRLCAASVFPPSCVWFGFGFGLFVLVSVFQVRGFP